MDSIPDDAPAPKPVRLRSRRLAQCFGCGLDPPSCLCGAMQPIAVRTHVAIAIHRVEVWKPSNTGRLATRLLEGATIRVHGAAHDDRSEVAEVEPVDPSIRRLVLFPLAEARVLDERDAETPVTLVVPDGNWRQARKIARRRAQAGGELVMLPPGPPTRYGLRRPAREGGISTLEAIARALRVLEGPRGEEVEAHVLATFDEWVARYRALRGTRPDE